VFQKKLLILSLAIVTCVTSCIIPDATTEFAEIDLQRNDSLMVVDEGDFRFQLALPKDLMITNTPAIEADAEGKKLYITCGPEFRILVTTSDYNQEDQGIFTHRMLDNEDQLCVYKRILPDGTAYDYGLKQCIAISNKTYIFQSDPTGEFDLNDALRMQLALTSVKL
jgi:hypothetical protein